MNEERSAAPSDALRQADRLVQSVVVVSVHVERPSADFTDRLGGILAGVRMRSPNVQLVHVPQHPLARHLRPGAVWEQRLLRRPWWYWEPSSEWTEQLRHELSRADVLIATYLPAAAATLPALASFTVPPYFIYDADNDERKLAGLSSTSSHVRRIQVIEDRVIEQADSVWIAGSEDLATLRLRHPRRRLVNVPNGVLGLPDLSDVEPTPRAAFVYGSWRHPPNAEGIQLLAEAESDSSGVLRVYGDIAARTRKHVLRRVARTQPNVEWRFLGYERNIVDLAGSGATGIVPVWGGAGTKQRTVQLAAMGVPFVATDAAVAGLPNWLSDAVIVVNSPAQLLEAALEGAQLSRACRRDLQRRVVTELGWPQLIETALCQSGF